MQTQLGIDLARTDEVRDAMLVHGERYLERVYTAAELRECAGDASRLAERFAAKEATMKALRRSDEALPWTSIAVGRDESGAPSIELTGAAAELAHQRGVNELTLSVTHRRALAAAVVLATTSK